MCLPIFCTEITNIFGAQINFTIFRVRHLYPGHKWVISEDPMMIKSYTPTN